MNQHEFLTFIKNGLKLNDEPQKEQIEQYLLGEEVDISIISPSAKNNIWIDYPVYDVLTKQFNNSENLKMAKRAFYLATILHPIRWAEILRYKPHAYQACKETGIAFDYVSKIISGSLHYGVINTYHFGQIKEMQTIIKQLQGNRKELTLFSEVFLYYGEDIDHEIRQNQQQKEETVQTFLLIFYLREWYREDAEKFAWYDTKLKEILYSMIKSSYQEDKEEISIELLEEAKQLYEQANKKITNLMVENDSSTGKMNRVNIMLSTEKKAIVLIVSYLLKNEDLIYHEALRFSFMRCEVSEYHAWLGLSVEQLHALIAELNLPFKNKLDLAAYGIFHGSFEQECEKGVKQLIEYYKENPEEYSKCFKYYKNTNSVNVFPIIAGMCLCDDPLFSKETLSSKNKNQIDEIYLHFLEHEIKRSNLDFYHGSKTIPVRTLDFIMDVFHLEDVEISYTDNNNRFCFLYSNKDIEAASVFKATTLIFEQSLAAKRVLSVWIKSMLAKQQGRAFLSHYEAARKAVNFQLESNIYEELSVYTGVKMVISAYIEQTPNHNQKDFADFIKNHRTDAEEIFSSVLIQGDTNIIPAVHAFYSEDLGLSYEELSKAMNHRLKTVVDEMERFFADKEMKLRPYIEMLTKDKNKNVKEAAIRLIRLWDDVTIAEELKEIHSLSELAGYIERHKVAGRKLLFQEIFSSIQVREKGLNRIVNPLLLEYYIAEYMSLKQVKRIRICEKLREFIQEEDMRTLFHSIYEEWILQGADTKVKNLLIPYMIHAGVKEVSAFKKKMDDFTEHSRGALAAFMAECMGLNGSDMALLLLDGISKKYKNKQVKAAAESAIVNAANALGITKDELGDKIVPSLGFSKARERIFDYGTRKFKAVLSTRLEILLFDETGKKIKSLPKPKASDDAELAKASESAFKDLKKELKVVLVTQKDRLTDAVLTGRSWKKEAWEQLFIKNPIMNSFAVSLIWAERDLTGKLIGTFRYMEDGTFNSSEEEEYKLSEELSISLLHPLDVEEELIETWKSQLDDYEITQPITQLTMPIFTCTEEEEEFTSIKRYDGKKVYFGSVRSVMDKYNFKRMSITDGGGYLGYYYEDSKLGIGVQMTFEFLYIGMQSDDSTSIQLLKFYQAQTIEYGSYLYGDVNDKNRVLPKDVPKKFMSFALMVGDLIASKALDE